MAKKTKTGKDKIDNELDFKDLDGLSDDLDFGELEDIDSADRNPSKAGIAKELGKEASKGFLDGLISQTTKKSLPDEYTHNYRELIDYADFGKQTFDENKTKVNKSVYKLGKEVKKILPFQFKMLDNYLSKFESDFEQMKQESEEAMRENAIQSNLAGIFDKQLEIQKAFEARRQAEEEVQSKERISTTKLNLDILTSIDSNISNQTAFTLQVSKEYFRKSLELQYKSYFVQADLLRTTRDYYKAFSIQLDDIVKNTGLPEFVKLNNTERISEVIRNQSIQSTYNALFSNSKYVQGLKGKVNKLISDKVSSFTDKVDTATDQLSMINSASEMGGSGVGMLGGILSGIFGTTIGEKLGDKISPKIKNMIKDNKAINTGANYMSMLGNSPSTLFSLLKGKASKNKDKYSDESNPLRFLASKMYGGFDELLGVADPGKQEFSVKGQSVLNHNKPAIFDNKVHRSISEIIPMYLSKILKENTDLRRMFQAVNKGKLYGKKNSFSESEELHYDYEGRSLITGSQLKSNIQNSVLSDNSSKNKLNTISNGIISASMNELNKDKSGNKDKLKILNDKKSQKLLEDYLTKASNQEGVNFDYKTVIEDITTEKANPKLEELTRGNPKLIELLSVLKESKANDNKFLNDRMKDVKRKYPTSGIIRLFSDASKIAGSKLINDIKDEQAEKVAKAFTIFITDVGRDVSISNIITGEAFKFMPSKDFKELTDVISVFINDVKRINANDDMLQESSLTVLLGIVNRGLKDNFEFDPEVFQTLYEYSPILGSKGKLTVDNLIERKLDKNNDNDFVSFEDIRSVVKMSKVEVNEKRTEIVSSKLLDGITGYLGNIKQDLKDAGSNPFAIGRVVVKHAKEASDAIVAKSKEKYKEASDALEGYRNALSSLSDEAVGKSADFLINKLDLSVAKITEMIKTEGMTRDEELKSLNEAKAKLTETVKDPSGLKDIERSIKTVTKYYEVNIKALTKLRDTLKAQKENIMSLRSENITDKIEFLSRIKTEIMTTLEKAKELLENARQAEESLVVT